MNRKPDVVDLVALYTRTLIEGVCVFITFALVISLAAIACDVRKHGVSSHDVKGFREGSSLVLSSRK